MSSTRQADPRLSDRLPSDWKRRVAHYSTNCAANYRRVLKKLEAFDSMSKEERERAAYVIVEKEEFRKLGIIVDDDD